MKIISTNFFFLILKYKTEALPDPEMPSESPPQRKGRLQPLSFVSAFFIILSLSKNLSFMSELGGDAQLPRISYARACQVNKGLQSSLESGMVSVK